MQCQRWRAKASIFACDKEPRCRTLWLSPGAHLVSQISWHLKLAGQRIHGHRQGITRICRCSPRPRSGNVESYNVKFIYYSYYWYNSLINGSGGSSSEVDQKDLQPRTFFYCYGRFSSSSNSNWLCEHINDENTLQSNNAPNPTWIAIHSAASLLLRSSARRALS